MARHRKRGRWRWSTRSRVHIDWKVIMPVNREITFLIVIIGEEWIQSRSHPREWSYFFFCRNTSHYPKSIIFWYYIRNIIKNDTLTRQMTNDSDEEDRSESIWIDIMSSNKLLSTLINGLLSTFLIKPISESKISFKLKAPGNLDFHKTKTESITTKEPLWYQQFYYHPPSIIR